MVESPEARTAPSAVVNAADPSSSLPRREADFSSTSGLDGASPCVALVGSSAKKRTSAAFSLVLRKHRPRCSLLLQSPSASEEDAEDKPQKRRAVRRATGKKKKKKKEKEKEKKEEEDANDAASQLFLLAGAVKDESLSIPSERIGERAAFAWDSSETTEAASGCFREVDNQPRFKRLVSGGSIGDGERTADFEASALTEPFAELHRRDQRNGTLASNQELNQEALNTEELNQEELNQEALNQEALNQEALNQEELNEEELNQEELKKEELNQEELNQDELNQEELNNEELKKEELNQEELNQEELNKGELNKGELNKEELNQEELNNDPSEVDKCRLFTEPLREPSLTELIEFLAFQAAGVSAFSTRRNASTALPTARRREGGKSFYFVKPSPNAALSVARRLASALLTHPGGLFDILASDELDGAKVENDFPQNASQHPPAQTPPGLDSVVFSEEFSEDCALWKRAVCLLSEGFGRAVFLRLERAMALLMSQTPSVLRWLGSDCSFCASDKKEGALQSLIKSKLDLVFTEASVGRRADALWLLHALTHFKTEKAKDGSGEEEEERDETKGQGFCRSAFKSYVPPAEAFTERGRGLASLALRIVGAEWRRLIIEKTQRAPRVETDDKENESIASNALPRVAIERLLKLPRKRASSDCPSTLLEESANDDGSFKEKEDLDDTRVISAQRVGRFWAFRRFRRPRFSVEVNSFSMQNNHLPKLEDAAMQGSVSPPSFGGILIRTDGCLPASLDEQICRDSAFNSLMRLKRRDSPRKTLCDICAEAETKFRLSWQGEKDPSCIALPTEALLLKRSSVHGFGVFATHFIPAGTVLLEYTGEVYIHPKNLEPEPPRLVEVRESRYDWQHGNCYCFSLSNEKTTRFVDATDAGNMARYINHSCEPNCESRLVEGERVAIVALRDIVAGEELFYDYHFSDSSKEACLCQAPSCRGGM